MNAIQVMPQKANKNGRRNMLEPEHSKVFYIPECNPWIV
jgi:hypothetical protein